MVWDSATYAVMANRIIGRIHSIALQLWLEEEGRQGLEKLLGHRHRGVRLKAAADCLAWNSKAAVTAVESLLTPLDLTPLAQR